MDGQKFPKIYLWIGVGALVLGLVGVGAFWFGKNGVTPSPSPSPSPSTSPTMTPVPLPTVTPSPSPTPKPKPSPTPTPKPTATPAPTPTSTPASLSMTLSADAGKDGFRSNNGGGNDGLDIRAGRNANLVTRGFVSFDWGSLPAGVTIDQAVLKMYQTSVTGNPYGVGGGSIKVDHLDYGDALENNDYSLAAISSSFGTLSSEASVGWREVDVTDAVRNDRTNSRSRSQYRLHFATETEGGDVTGDFAYFEAANNSNGTGNTPQLFVRYH